MWIIGKDNDALERILHRILSSLVYHSRLKPILDEGVIYSEEHRRPSGMQEDNDLIFTDCFPTDVVDEAGHRLARVDWIQDNPIGLGHRFQCLVAFGCHDPIMLPPDLKYRAANQAK